MVHRPEHRDRSLKRVAGHEALEREPSMCGMILK